MHQLVANLNKYITPITMMIITTVTSTKEINTATRVTAQREK